MALLPFTAFALPPKQVASICAKLLNGKSRAGIDYIPGAILKMKRTKRLFLVLDRYYEPGARTSNLETREIETDGTLGAEMLLGPETDRPLDKFTQIGHARMGWVVREMQVKPSQRVTEAVLGDILEKDGDHYVITYVEPKRKGFLAHKLIDGLIENEPSLIGVPGDGEDALAIIGRARIERVITEIQPNT